MEEQAWYGQSPSLARTRECAACIALCTSLCPSNDLYTYSRSTSEWHAVNVPPDRPSCRLDVKVDSEGTASGRRRVPGCSIASHVVPIACCFDVKHTERERERSGEMKIQERINKRKHAKDRQINSIIEIKKVDMQLDRRVDACVRACVLACAWACANVVDACVQGLCSPCKEGCGGHALRGPPVCSLLLEECDLWLIVLQTSW